MVGREGNLGAVNRRRSGVGWQGVGLVSCGWIEGLLFVTKVVQVAPDPSRGSGRNLSEVELVGKRNRRVVGLVQWVAWGNVVRGLDFAGDL
jgi:hypothetical protein